MDLYISLKTDILCYHYDWFKKRVKDGYFDVRTDEKNINRYYFKDFEKIYLWSKNPTRLLKNKTNRDLLRKLKTDYEIVLETTPYDKFYEENLFSKKTEFFSNFRSYSQYVSTLHIALSYSPIFYTDINDLKWHMSQFDFFCRRIRGLNKKVYISFDINEKIVKSDLVSARQLTNFEQNECYDILKEIANKYNMTVEIKPNINNIKAIDMGVDNFCQHKCLYCHCNNNYKEIITNNAKHIFTQSTIMGIVKEDDNINIVNFERSLTKL